MTFFGGALGFLSPWLLLAVAALPLLWVILRALPPAPLRRRFAGVVLLVGAKDTGHVSTRMPWWLVLLRMAVLAAVILGLAGPVLAPERARTPGKGPLLIVMDASWASARDWPERMARLSALLTEAETAARPVALLRRSAPMPPRFSAAASLRQSLPEIVPLPWGAQPGVAALLERAEFSEAVWFSDGLEEEGRAALAEVLRAKAPLRIVESDSPVLALRPVVRDGARLSITALRAPIGPGAESALLVQGRDPAGQPQVFARETLRFASGAADGTAELALPAELRARLSRLVLAGTRSAGAVALTDDSLRRREVALVMSGTGPDQGLELVSPLYYISLALAPEADLLTGALEDVLPAKPDVVVLVDVARFTEGERAALTEWTEAGGTLLRFAGPRFAAEITPERDPLLPVALRAGGHRTDGTMSWSAPKVLAPFAEDSPFAGLPVPDEVRVRAQVLAQPGPELAGRTIAALSDGTPLVTRAPLGQGQVVLFHTTANADWSSLPLSGLFVEMLNRLVQTADLGQRRRSIPDGSLWRPVALLDGFGQLRRDERRAPITGAVLKAGVVGPELPPGLYMQSEQVVALNVLGPERRLAPARWPTDLRPEPMTQEPPRPLGHWLLMLAAVLFAVEALATLLLTGRLRRVGAAVLIGALAVVSSPPAEAQEKARISRSDIRTAGEIVLAHVLTGDAALDAQAAAGLDGLSRVIGYRSSVEPSAPRAVDLERDELALFPLLYWPVSADQPRPSAGAYDRLNAYLRGGGLILFDTRDWDVSGYGGLTPEGARLQELAAPLSIPPLEPVPRDHVLTRTFYLLDSFPGRYASGALWAEAAPPSAERAEGMPFRNLNDGVSPVLIGGGDWAAAWAVDARGVPLARVGEGYAGERQREMSYRFGLNLVMYALSGNYKSDQVHVPALLERLSQ